MIFPLELFSIDFPLCCHIFMLIALCLFIFLCFGDLLDCGIWIVKNVITQLVNWNLIDKSTA